MTNAQRNQLNAIAARLHRRVSGRVRYVVVDTHGETVTARYTWDYEPQGTVTLDRQGRVESSPYDEPQSDALLWAAGETA